MENLPVRRPQVYAECRTCEALNGVIVKARNHVPATPDLLENGTDPHIVVDCMPQKSIDNQHSVGRWLEPSIQKTGERGLVEFVLPDMRIYTSCPGMIEEKRKRASRNKK